MKRVRRVGYEVKALSNLMRRKIWDPEHSLQYDIYTETQGMIIGFLCRNKDKVIFQKDIEKIFYIQRSTASRLLQRMEKAGLIERKSIESDGRYKQVVPTEKAMAVNKKIEARIEQMEAALVEGLTKEETDQFMTIIQKLKQNLM